MVARAPVRAGAAAAGRGAAAGCCAAMGAGVRRTAWASASGAPQVRQNLPPPSTGAWQRGQAWASAGATAASPRAGACVGPVAATTAPAGGGEGSCSGGGAGTVFERSIAGVARAAGAAAGDAAGATTGGAGDGAAAVARGFPHVTQKRIAARFALPQCGQIDPSERSAAVSPFGVKRTSGAAGRGGLATTARRTGAACKGSTAGCAALVGADVVAASGEVRLLTMCADAGGATPRGGVGAAPPRLRRCPQSWQNTSWPGLSRPHVAQITSKRWDTGVAWHVNS
jgi:hypothetical protein